MAGPLNVNTYTGRTAVQDAHDFIETLGDGQLVELEAWAEAETPTIMIVWTGV